MNMAAKQTEFYKIFKGHTTLITKKTNFSSYRGIRKLGSAAKSYMRKGFLIHTVHEEMRKYLTKYEEDVSHI
jgi:hypothetical protein